MEKNKNLEEEKMPIDSTDVYPEEEPRPTEIGEPDPYMEGYPFK
jgi:hypothetical protein